MRSAGAGLFGALLMVAPLVAIPILAVVGVPQFAPTVSALEGDAGAGDEAGADEFDDEAVLDDLGERPSRSRSAAKRRTAKRRTADDLYAPLAEPLAEPLESAAAGELEPARARETDGDDVESLPELSEPAGGPEAEADSAAAPPFASTTPPGRRIEDRSLPSDPADEDSPAPAAGRRLWSNSSPRGSLGEWEIDEETGAPRGGAAEATAAPPRGSRARRNTGDFEPAGEPGTAAADAAPGRADDGSGPIDEAGAINFLARNRPADTAAPARTASTDGRTAPRWKGGTASRAAPADRAAAPPAAPRAESRGKARPIPTDDLEGATAPETEVAMADFGAESAGETELGTELSADDEEVDPLSEAELQRGLARDPLSSGSGSRRSVPAPTSPAARSAGPRATVLDFPDPAAEDFQGAVALGETAPSSAGEPDRRTASLDPAEAEFGIDDSSDKMEPARRDAPSGGPGPSDAALESLTWTQATAQLKTWGIRKYRLEADPETEGFVFVCMAPDPNSMKVARRFETTGADPLSAVRAAIGEISEWYASRTRRGAAAGGRP